MIAPEGRKILLTLLFFTFFTGIISFGLDLGYLKFIYYLSGALFIFCINFFRDPLRETPQGDGLLIAPADGKVVLIEDVEDEIIGAAKQISIFLNVFNVHSNKIPIDGIIENVEYKKGQFKAAFDHTASQVNEQTVVVIAHQNLHLKIKQIAGLIARRIHCYVKTGEKVNTGQRFGFIMFGSRTDLIVPSHSEIKVRVGDKVKGGQTIIGQLEK